MPPRKPRRFTDTERGTLAYAAELLRGLAAMGDLEADAHLGVLEVLMAVRKRPPPRLRWQDFRAICEAEMGPRLAQLASPGPAWYGRLQGALNTAGISDVDAVRLARAALQIYRRDPVDLIFLAVRAASILAQADQLGISGEPQKGGDHVARSRRVGLALGLPDDDDTPG